MAKIESTEERSVKQLGFITDKKAGTVEVLGNYLDRRKLTDALGNQYHVTTWHKSISEIIDEAAQSSFVVERFIEPRPLPEMAEISQKDFDKLSKVPDFMIFRLMKID
jgi:hypothetical protein